MVEGWRPVVIAEELYNVAKNHYEKKKEELKLRHGIRSLTAFMNYCLRESIDHPGEAGVLNGEV